MMLLRSLSLFPASSASECPDQILPRRKSRVNVCDTQSRVLEPGYRRIKKYWAEAAGMGDVAKYTIAQSSRIGTEWINRYRGKRDLALNPLKGQCLLPMPPKRVLKNLRVWGGEYLENDAGSYWETLDVNMDSMIPIP
ncbi:hypothetical protein DUI87_07633 [Hirundo rustica rustica]|uniref:Uncharacterized protein n=1 Tax=Hirundo rustica rustica TaxID=333673 RepID=A0A3M0KQ77_HIRRU|nr:hypothetical protein DUI87_07633 [Hirundo rustica rustica]